MKILSIGNSFSEDAQAYLKGVCDAEGLDLTCANLYIGGCTLIRHCENIKRGVKDYVYFVNGAKVNDRVSVEEILTSEDFDVITLQESSYRSCELCHFEPYLHELIEYVKKHCPNAKVALHMTWGYGKQLTERMKQVGLFSTEEMFEKVIENYTKLAEKEKVDFIIPSGKVLYRLFLEGYNIHRDAQHASLGIGRYALALTWMRKLFGVSVANNSFRDFEVFVSREEIAAAQRAVDDIVT